MAAVAHSPRGYVERPRPSGLADVLEIILDKGIVIDAYVRVSLIGIEILTVDARIVVASVDTYLRFAEAVNRLDLTEAVLVVRDPVRDGQGEHLIGDSVGEGAGLEAASWSVHPPYHPPFRESPRRTEGHDLASHGFPETHAGGQMSGSHAP